VLIKLEFVHSQARINTLLKMNGMKAYKLIILIGSFIMVSMSVSAWNEENTDSLGMVVTAHSVKDFHSSFHYDLTLLLAVKMGFSPDTAELMARYCALVDQINPKPGYPYPLALNNISIPDTFSGWHQSLAGTERGNIFTKNVFGEWAPQYWHFPIKSMNDTISGAMVYGAYPQVFNPDFRNSPYYWRVPSLPSLQNIMSWGIYGTGQAGNPGDSPVDVMFWDVQDAMYKPVEPGSLQAFAIYLHVLGDAYSHEHCMVEDTLRSHPPTHDFCGLNYHSHYEFAYNNSIVAEQHAEKAAQAIWRALREYKRVNGIQKPCYWAIDSNGFLDGDGIPDVLEDDYDADYTESFMEKWKSPAPDDMTGDGIVNNFDHTTWRILLCNIEYCNISVALDTVAFVDEGSGFQPRPLVDYYDSLYWSSDGDGAFNNPNMLNATYQHGSEDLQQGFVVLRLHIINYRGCEGEILKELKLFFIQNQSIILPGGWSGFSTYLQATEVSLDSLGKEFSDDLVILQNQDAYYMPGNPGNTLNSLSKLSGYQVKLSDSVAVLIPGWIDRNDSIQIFPGWNLIPVLSPCQQEVDLIFAPFSSQIILVKEAVGLKMYWPGAGVFTLETLNPGNSYFIKANSPFKIGFLHCDN